MFKSYYERRAAEYYAKYLAAMESEDFKTAERYFNEYENYQKESGNVSKNTVRE